MTPEETFKALRRPVPSCKTCAWNFQNYGDCYVAVKECDMNGLNLGAGSKYKWEHDDS